MGSSGTNNDLQGESKVANWHKRHKNDCKPFVFLNKICFLKTKTLTEQDRYFALHGKLFHRQIGKVALASNLIY